VESGGGGGGSSSPRCDLDISDTRIKRGDEITLRWDTSRATEVVIKDNRGNTIVSTAKLLGAAKEDLYDGSIKLKPTRDTEYTLNASRGSKDRTCQVKVVVEDDEVVVLQTRDQQPLVAGISLSQVPYTGFEAGPFMTLMFYALLVAWGLYIAYFLVIRRSSIAGYDLTTPVDAVPPQTPTALEQSVAMRPDVFVPPTHRAAVSQTEVAVPMNLPTGTPVVGYASLVTEETHMHPHQVSDALVTELEDRAHAQKALLSSDAVRYFIGTTEGSLERAEALDAVISAAKEHYPLEDGWVVINEARMQNLCTICQTAAPTSATAPFMPAVVPEGSGSLAEAIVTGNVVAAFSMIGHRPMFALADAAADLDSVVRMRKGEAVTLSELLVQTSATLSDAQLAAMISALTGALDGTYTNEADAVKMAIMKAVKVVA
jgi:hypothetical protein